MDYNTFLEFYEIQSKEYMKEFDDSNSESKKRLALKMIVINNILCHKLVQEYFDNNETLSELRHRQKKLKEAGVRITILDKQIKDYQVIVKYYNDLIKTVGKTMTLMLDMWQDNGATIDDLCSLFNYKPKDIEHINKLETENEKTFSGIAFFVGDDEHREFMFNRTMCEAIKEYRNRQPDPALPKMKEVW